MTHPLQWFLDRIGKTVECTDKIGKYNIDIKDSNVANYIFQVHQNKYGNTFRDPHPLSSSMLLCWTLECSYCNRIVAEEGQNDNDREQAAKVFEGDGWKRLDNGTINCGCK